MNKTLFNITKIKAERAEITPEGISLAAVLGFLRSMSLSRYLLKAIAALLAKTIHKRTKINKCH